MALGQAGRVPEPRTGRQGKKERPSRWARGEQQTQDGRNRSGRDPRERSRPRTRNSTVRSVLTGAALRSLLQLSSVYVTCAVLQAGLSGEDDGPQQSPHLSGPSPESPEQKPPWGRRGTGLDFRRGQSAPWPGRRPLPVPAERLWEPAPRRAIPGAAVSSPASRTNLRMSLKLHDFQNSLTVCRDLGSATPQQGGPCFAGCCKRPQLPAAELGTVSDPGKQEHAARGVLFC